jgi:hypothetical protein
MNIDTQGLIMALCALPVSSVPLGHALTVQVTMLTA